MAKIYYYESVLSLQAMNVPLLPMHAMQVCIKGGAYVIHLLGLRTYNYTAPGLLSIKSKPFHCMCAVVIFFWELQVLRYVGDLSLGRVSLPRAGISGEYYIRILLYA